MNRSLGVLRIGRYLGAFTILSCLLAGCTGHRAGPVWGQDVSYSPGWARVIDAARVAALDPQTWIPAAGSALFIAGDLDHEVSDWATEETPIFGSERGADSAGDYLVAAMAGAYLFTSLATPAGAEDDRWAEVKFKGLSVGMSASIVNYGLTAGMKGWTARDRPDGSDSKSFPSGHSSSSAVLYALANRNLGFTDIPDRGKAATRIGLGALSIGTAWSRVEAGKHFPSDVLAGLALGHFLGVFFHHAFLHDGDFSVTLETAPGGAAAALSWAF